MNIAKFRQVMKIKDFFFSFLQVRKIFTYKTTAELIGDYVEVCQDLYFAPLFLSGPFSLTQNRCFSKGA